MAGLVPATHRATIATACWETQVAPRTHDYFVYMLASKPYGTIYIGVTNDLRRRVGEHLDGKASKFTKRYTVTRLVWFETWGDVHGAIQRETSLKRWPRNWKINLGVRLTG
jgi:putative endonuclease